MKGLSVSHGTTSGYVSGSAEGEFETPGGLIN